MSRTEDASLLFSKNVPLGGTLCLLSCCCSGGIQRLSLENGTPIGGEMIGDGSKAAVQISENEIVEVSGQTPSPVVYNVMSGREIATLDVGHLTYPLGVAFLPRSQLLVTGGTDKRVVVWNRRHAVGFHANRDDSCEESGGDPPFAVKCQLEEHSRFVGVLDAWKEEEPRNNVVSGSEDRTGRVWDVVREECVSVLQGHRNTVWGLCHDSRKQIQFTAGSDGAVIAWDFRSSQHQKIFHMGVPNRVATLCYRSKRSQLVVPCTGGRLQVIDIRMLRSDKPEMPVVHEWNTGYSAWVCGSCDVPDDNWDFFVTSGGGDNHVKAWKENGKCVWDWGAPDIERYIPADLCGIHPFIRGDPCVVFERVDSDEFHGEKCQFLTGVVAFSMRILLTVSSTEMGFWKWVLIL